MSKAYIFLDLFFSWYCLHLYTTKADNPNPAKIHPQVGILNFLAGSLISAGGIAAGAGGGTAGACLSAFRYPISFESSEFKVSIVEQIGY